MRIPIYRSQMRPTSEAPGARITARKSATPFVQAALAKGGVVTEVAKQAAEYSNMRYKMLVETQKNEAIFSAKEALNELSRTLEKSEDIGNIFDGEMKYDQGVEGVYEEMRAKVGKNKYALADFENSFRQMEIPIKFRLKEVVDIKIEKRRQAALKALEDQQVNTFSDPYLDYTSDDLILSQAGLQSIHDQAVTTGGVNPQIMGNVSERVLTKAFKNMVVTYAGTDMTRTLNLVGLYDEIDQVRAGELNTQDMKLINSVPPHVLNMLQAVPGDVAIEAINSAFITATKFEKAQRERQDALDKLEEDNKVQQQADLKEEFLLRDPLFDASAEDLQNLYEKYPGVEDYIAVRRSGVASNYEVLNGLRSWAFDNFNVTSQDNDFYLSQIKKSTARPATSDPIIKEILNQKIVKGNLTFEDVDAASYSLTLQDQTNFFTALKTNKTAGVSQGKLNITNILEGQAAQILEPDAAARILNEISSLHVELDNHIQDERLKNNILTENQIIAYANNLALNSTGYANILEEEYETIVGNSTLKTNFPNLSTSLPASGQSVRQLIKELDDEVEKIGADKLTGPQDADYTNARRQLSKLLKKYDKVKR
jgi:hypothetical protein